MTGTLEKHTFSLECVLSPYNKLLHNTVSSKDNNPWPLPEEIQKGVVKLSENSYDINSPFKQKKKKSKLYNLEARKMINLEVLEIITSIDFEYCSRKVCN